MDRLYEAKIPTYGEVILENESWVLFNLFTGHSEWDNLKLISKKPRLHKASFLLGWNGERLARSKDCQILLEHSPEVYEWIVKGLT